MMGIYKREIRKMQQKQRRAAVKKAYERWIERVGRRFDAAVDKVMGWFEKLFDRAFASSHKKEVARLNKDLARAALEFEEMLRLKDRHSLNQEEAEKMQNRLSRKIDKLGAWSGIMPMRLFLLFTPLCFLSFVLGLAVIPARFGLGEPWVSLITLGLLTLSAAISFVIAPVRAARKADQCLAEWKVLESYCSATGIKHVWCSTTIFDECEFRRYLPKFFPTMNPESARNFDVSHQKAREILAS